MNNWSRRPSGLLKKYRNSLGTNRPNAFRSIWPLGEFQLLGALNGLYRQGRIQARFARRKAKDWLSVWICHLVLCALEDSRHPAVSILIDTDGAVRFKPVDRPETVLKDLLENYLRRFAASAALFS